MKEGLVGIRISWQILPEIEPTTFSSSGSLALAESKSLQTWVVPSGRGLITVTVNSREIEEPAAIGPGIKTETISGVSPEWETLVSPEFQTKFASKYQKLEYFLREHPHYY